jgi:hypothetical protein
MAKIQINTYPAKAEGGFVSIAFCITGRSPAPMPARVIEATKTAQVLEVMQAMKAEGQAMLERPGFVISARVIEGRAPAGFKDAMRGYLHVNL